MSGYEPGGVYWESLHASDSPGFFVQGWRVFEHGYIAGERFYRPYKTALDFRTFARWALRLQRKLNATKQPPKPERCYCRKCNPDGIRVLAS